LALWYKSLSLLLSQNSVCNPSLLVLLRSSRGKKITRIHWNSLVVEVLLPAEGDQEACPF